MNLASRVSRFGRHSPKKNPIWSPLGFLQLRNSPNDRSLSTGWPSENSLNFPMPSSRRDLNSPTFWGSTSKLPINHLGRKSWASKCTCLFITCQRRGTQESWEMQQWSWQPRGLTGRWQWWCSTSWAFKAPLQRLASTPPGNLPHRAVCYDMLLRMRPLKRRWRSSSMMSVSTQICNQTKYHSTVCSFWI